jgi:23S rRNA pseudouridine955/2504/2580 synthase
VSFGVIEQLRARVPRAGPRLAHRLDRETSGLLLLAKQRRRWSLARGAAEARGGAISRWCGGLAGAERPSSCASQARHPSGARHVSVGEAGSPHGPTSGSPSAAASSRRRSDARHWRTHQIRVHLAHLGFPIAATIARRLRAQPALREARSEAMFLHARARVRPSARRRADRARGPADELDRFLRKPRSR